MTSRRTLAFALATALAVVACQGQAAPTLTDPKEILAAAVRTTAEQPTVRIDATIDGEIAIDLLGSGGTPVEFSGSTASADIDLIGNDARATFSLTLLNLTGEFIALDGTGYLKSTMTGPNYLALPLGATEPQASADPTTILAGLTDLLAQPGLDPVKGEDVECGGTTCYTVLIELTPDELGALGGGLEMPTNLPIPIPIPIPDLTAATVDLTVRVTKDTTTLAGLGVAADLGDAGKLDLDLTFSKWGDPVTISAPPADQVAPAG